MLGDNRYVYFMSQRQNSRLRSEVFNFQTQISHNLSVPKYFLKLCTFLPTSLDKYFIYFNFIQIVMKEGYFSKI